MNTNTVREKADETFVRLCEVWDYGIDQAKSQRGFLKKDYWKTGNTVDCVINYLVQTNQKDEKRRIRDSFDYVYAHLLYPDHWRDDYGWWGNALVNACRPASNGKPSHAAILGFTDEDVDQFLAGAKECWNVLRKSADENLQYYNNCTDTALKKVLPSLGGGYCAWNHDSVEKYLSDKSITYVPNTVTNVGYWALSIGLYEITPGSAQAEKLKYKEAIEETLNWFITVSNQKYDNESILLNTKNLIRETVNPWAHSEKWCHDASRGWTADQGVYLYCLYKCLTIFPHLSTPINALFLPVREGFMPNSGNSSNTLVCDGSFREYVTLPVPEDYDSNVGNFNDNYCTGPGVLVRYLAAATDPIIYQYIKPVVKRSVETVWTNRDQDPKQDKVKIKNQILCWWEPIRDSDYSDRFLKDNDGRNEEIWYLALQASGLDLFTAALRMNINEAD
ncbi:MAG: hypothetical protein EKK48_10205 [Candidatus Melainabacteria bacterium]|nr:MAG: hypothetical protein EKK48_10205 [Candidatus Melainabacteria bacterium]